MRLIWFLFCLSMSLSLSAQNYFPVKMGDSWSLVSEEGNLWDVDSVDAIHLYDTFGYFIFQNEQNVGLINRSGQILIPAIKSDIRPISTDFIEFSENGVWSIGDLQGNRIFSEDYQSVYAIDEQRIKIKINDLWGCIDTNGRYIVPPSYDKIDWDEAGFYVVQKDAQLGVIDQLGRKVLNAEYDKIFFLDDRGFAFSKDGKWGFCNLDASVKTAIQYLDFKNITNGYLKIQKYNESGFELLSLETFKVAAVSKVKFAFPYSNGAIVFSVESGKVGLLDKFGNIVLSPVYQEIAGFKEDFFRVKQNNLWAVVGVGDSYLYPFEYNFISAPQNNTCILIKDEKSAVGTLSGEVISAFDYDEIKWGKNDQIHCFKDGALFLFFEQDGKLLGEQSFNQFLTLKIGQKNKEQVLRDGYQLKDFEWVFSADQNKWGLRNKETDSYKIAPQFDEIRVFDDLGFTLTSVRHPQSFQISKVDFRFMNVFGLVNNKLGICTEMDLVHIFFEDFESGSDVARCIFKDLTFGLVNRNGYYSVARYKYLGPFKDGLAAAAQTGELVGGLNIQKEQRLGKLDDLIESMLSNSKMIDYTEYANTFRDNADLCCFNCTWGFIDNKGTWIIPAVYDFAKEASNGVGIVNQEGKWGAVKARGEIVLDFIYTSVDFIKVGGSSVLRVQQDNPRYGVIDNKANEVIPFAYEALGSISGDRIAVKKNGLWGFIDKSGAIVIGCAFNDVRAFSEGLAAVRKGNKWGYINEEGKLILSFNYNRCGDFREGLSWVYSNSEAYFIDKAGEKAFDASFASASDFDGGVARVKEGGKYGLIDKFGNYVLRPKYLNISSFNKYGLAEVEFVGTSNARFALINRSGNLLGPYKFSEIRPFSEGLAAVKTKKHWGFINPRGDWVIPASYFEVGDFSSGRASVFKDGRCGYVNRSGDLVVDLLYNNCYDFEEDKAVVKLPRMRDGLIDLDGNILIKPSINTLYSFTEGRGLVRDQKRRFYFISENANMYDGYYQSAQKFQYGVAPVKRKNKWGMINLKGMWVCRPKYSQINRLDNGLMLAKIDGYIGLTDINGAFLAPMKYLQLDISKENIFLLETSDGVDYLRSDGRWIWRSN